MNKSRLISLGLGLALVASCSGPGNQKNAPVPAIDDSHYRDGSDGKDWPGFGRTYGEQHFSPLDQISIANVGKLGLAWSHDLPIGNSATGPVEVDGVVYVATFYSVIRALDATSGRELWSYDPKVPQVAGRNLRFTWGVRGIAYWNGKIYTGTADGRLIAVDAKTGHEVWSAQTYSREEARYITGAPRIFAGKVIIGQGGADVSPTRGYVTTYDAETGKQLWRFYVVPGNPANGFENDAMKMAAKTWSGEWWKFGGGGHPWNAMSYDPETNTVIVGTGNGAPWNHRIRSQGKGDNLFLCSIVGLDADTGKYKWHYQVNPGESWDFNAVMDMEFADLTIAGKPRKVLMTAPKNGFFYVIDRTNGQFISAKPLVEISWAKGIDPATGKPIEDPRARFPNDTKFVMKPGAILGGHSWMPMAYSPQTRLAYIPVSEMPVSYTDAGIDKKKWSYSKDYIIQPGLIVGLPDSSPQANHSALVAWDPVTQKEAWRIKTPAVFAGGVAATAGGLVFQGQVDHKFNAYDAKTGKLVWSFDAKAPIIGPPIVYSVNGREYVTVVTGWGTSAGALGPLVAKYNIQYRTQARRVLTFALDGKATLPNNRPDPLQAAADPTYRSNPALEQQGMIAFAQNCTQCHGGTVIAAGNAPDLRASAVPPMQDLFMQIVHDGALLDAGMPKFYDLPPQKIEAIRQYVRSRAADLRAGRQTSPNAQTSLTTAKP